MCYNSNFTFTFVSGTAGVFGSLCAQNPHPHPSEFDKHTQGR